MKIPAPTARRLNTSDPYQGRIFAYIDLGSMETAIAQPGSVAPSSTREPAARYPITFTTRAGRSVAGRYDPDGIERVLYAGQHLSPKDFRTYLKLPATLYSC